MKRTSRIRLRAPSPCCATRLAAMARVLLDHECRIPTAHALESHTTRQRSLQRHRDDSVSRLVPECAPCGATFDDSGVRRAGPASSWRYPAALRTCFLSRGDILNATDRKYSTIWRRTALRRARWAVVKLILRSGAGPVGRKKWTSTTSAHSCMPPGTRLRAGPRDNWTASSSKIYPRMHLN